MKPPLNPVLGYGHRLARLIAGRKKPSPTSDDFLIRPRLGKIRIKPQQYVQMIIHHRETTDGHREDLSEFLEPVLNPILAVLIAFTEQERATNATRDAVVPVSNRRINQLVRAIVMKDLLGQHRYCTQPQ